MKKRLMHAACSILMLAGLCLESHASAPFLETQTVTFQGFHDPGYLVATTELGEALELWFHYELISYDVVSTWERGERFKLGIDSELGTGIARERDAAFYKVFFPRGRDPIEAVEERCVANNGSTMGLAQCYRATARYLDLDIDYLMRDLAGRPYLEDESEQFTEAMTNARSMYSRLFSAVWDHNGGSIGAVNQWTTLLQLIYAERAVLEALY